MRDKAGLELGLEEVGLDSPNPNRQKLAVKTRDFKTIESGCYDKNVVLTSFIQ